MQNNIFSGLFIGQNLVTLKEVDSTNTFLKTLASNSTPVPEGTVIMAEHQFAGRGQQLNGWFTEAGKNLTFSILLKPWFINADQQFGLTQAVSIGVAKALQNVAGEQIKIKWPNDIYYGNKKLGGILIENMLQGARINNCVVGIGLNINQEAFPDHLPNAVSLRQILHKDYDLQLLLSDICSHIEACYLQLKVGRINELNTQYLNELFGLNKVLKFRSEGQDFVGTIKGVTARGLLKVDSENGPREYNLKGIQFLAD